MPDSDYFCENYNVLANHGEGIGKVCVRVQIGESL